MCLILQYNALKSTVLQHSSWHTGRALSEQTGSCWPEEGAMAGDGRAEGSAAAGGRGQAAASLVFDVDGPGSACWIQFCLPSWKNDPVLSGSFLLVDHTVALDGILNSCCNLPVLLTFGACDSKATRASSDEETPLAISCVVQRFGASVNLFLLSLSVLSLGLQFHLFTSLHSNHCHFCSIVIAWYFLAVPGTSMLLLHLLLES